MKSYSQSASLKELPTLTRSKICFERPDLEQYKTKCEVCEMSYNDCKSELDMALDSQSQLAFYQQRPAIVTHAIITLVLGALVLSKINK